MTGTRGMSLSEALAVIQAHHPHWHVWPTPLTVCAMRRDDHFTPEQGGPGATLTAPTPELLDHELAAWEHKTGWPA